MAQRDRTFMNSPIYRMVLRTALAMALGLGVVTSKAVAVTLDAETHDVLISKLSEVRSQLNAGDSSYVPTTLRMADLLSDRARLRDMDSMSKTGETSLDAKKDREQSLRLIEEVLPKLSAEQKVRANLQRAQLCQILDQPKKAEALLLEIRKGQKGSEEYWTATDLLADLNFSIGQFAEGERLYNEIQHSAKKNSFAQYRLAWCALHLGREVEAAKKLDALLANDKLESGLRIEASRDLAIFTARLPFQSSLIQKISRASAGNQETERANLKLFAEELKRLGKKKESSLVFLAYLKLQNSGEENQMGQAELFENLVHIQKNKEALTVLEKLVQSKCDDKCADVQMKVHKTLRNWAALEDKKASTELLQSFRVYAQMKPVDQNALLFGIKVAQDNRDHKASLALLSILIENTKDEKVLETALLAQIQSAEKSKILAEQLQAYDLYLKRGKDGKLKSEIQMNRIETLIALGQMKEAETAAEDVYRQAKNKETGDLLLGIYQKTRQSEKERQLSFDMSKGKTDSEYFKNYKRLSLDLTKKRLEAKTADKSDFELLIDIAKSSKDASERFNILSDAYLVALKAEDFERLKKAAIELISISQKLDRKKQDLALEKRMFVADLELDFKTSAQLEAQMQKGRPFNSTEAFRLVLKSRLAGTPKLDLEKKLLADNNAKLEQRTWILEQQMQSSKQPFRLLKDNQSLLLSRRELNARFALMALANGRESEARSYLQANSRLKTSVFGMILSRREALIQMTRDYKSAVQTQLKSKSLTGFNSSLDNRLAAMKSFEKKYLRHNVDAVLGLIAQGYMSGVHITLARDLEKASREVPVPASMKKEFAAQLQAKAEDLKKSVSESEGQMEQAWTSTGFEAEMAQVFAKANSLQRQALLKEISLWKAQSYGTIQRSWSRLERQYQRNETTSLASMYSRVQKNPFRAELTKELAQAEEERGNHVMSAFLNQRDHSLTGI